MTIGQINIIDFLHKLQNLKASWQHSADNLVEFMLLMREWEECHVAVKKEFVDALEAEDIVFFDRVQPFKDDFQLLEGELNEVDNALHDDMEGKPIDYKMADISYRFSAYLVELSYFSRELQQYLNKYTLVYGKPQLKQVAPEPQRELTDILPPALQNDEAVKIFQRALDAQMIEYTGAKLKWKGSKQLLAYFAERLSKKFGLSNKMHEKGIATAWKPFETLFDVKDLSDAKQNWMRVNTTFLPTKYKEIDSLFQ